MNNRAPPFYLAFQDIGPWLGKLLRPTGSRGGSALRFAS
jgi:hypothetical protein